MREPILSILICTIPEREAQFNKLLDHLRSQQTEEVEIIWSNTPRGKDMPVGKKRQTLIDRAFGDYVVFIDDDDWVSDDYVSSILQAAKEAPDCIGLRINVTGIKGEQHAAASNRYNRWKSNSQGFDYVRAIYHKTPVKREHALAIGYKPMHFGEDHDYSRRLKSSGLLKKEVFIDKELYFYRFKFEEPKKKYGMEA